MRIQAIVLVLLVLLLASCMQVRLNRPELVDDFYQRKENLQLEYFTEKGRQVAYYLPPLRFPAAPPGRVAILYPGINSVALSWLKFIDLRDHPTTAFLLIDYPGRGLSEGMMQPELNHLNTLGALEALAKHFGQDRLLAEINLLGHSFGTGAALQFANLSKVEHIVLVAPFNDLKQAVRKKSLILSLLMPAQIDNRELIKQLLASDQPPQITIFHGELDATLPIAMGRELAAIDPGKINFFAFAEDGHVNILSRRRSLIFASLHGGND